MAVYSNVVRRLIPCVDAMPKLDNNKDARQASRLMLHACRTHREYPKF